MTLEDSGAPLARHSALNINDEECSVSHFLPSRDRVIVPLSQVGFCGVCEVAAPVRRVTVRGLCVLSMFDRVYNYVINEEGQPMYLGSRTSVLFYNTTIPSWVWFDRWEAGPGSQCLGQEACLTVSVLVRKYAYCECLRQEVCLL